jgi:hypothetical protein
LGVAAQRLADRRGRAGYFARASPWRRDFEQTLPDLCQQDIGGSGFAITGYVVHAAMGGDAALERLRKRLRQRGLRLMLDFVPNHTATDHPWVEQHPDYFVHGSEMDLARAPQNYARVASACGSIVLAYGRDPHFPSWPDALQLDYGNPALQAAMIGELHKIAALCDGVRCDMATLVLPEVFERTWGVRPESFWLNAIASMRGQQADFVFLAEAYWDLEWTLLQQGFDYAYDKRLYDRLKDRQARGVRKHLGAGPDYQDRLARFLENHDERRAAAVFPAGVHEAAAVLTYLTPGLRFFHQGQFDGSVKRISAHLVRGPREPVQANIRRFYERLLTVLRQPLVRQGEWRLLDCVAAWEGNGSFDAVIAYGWQDAHVARLVVVVNYADHHSQCYVRLPFAGLSGATWRLRDLLGEARYERDGYDLQFHGLYLDVPAWHCHVLEMTRCDIG